LLQNCHSLKAQAFLAAWLALEVISGYEINIHALKVLDELTAQGTASLLIQ